MMPKPSKEWDVTVAGMSYYSGVLAQAHVRDRRFYSWTKRLLDIMLALLGLALLSPLLLFVAACIKIEDPRGSVFFRQVRIGKNERQFHMVKFRTMVTGAEGMLNDLLGQNEIDGKMFKMKEDPRITRFGRLLRKTSVDELPQLLNVLRGEMSLVGPRPPLQREFDQYTVLEKQRLTVVPGCTGLWQVSGRNGLSFDEMVELDLYYIRNRSILLDAKLILKTIKVMVYPNNAY